MADQVGQVKDIKFDYEEKIMFFASDNEVYFFDFSTKKSN